MKTHVWNQAYPFEGKVNFVDSNNVVLGYDLYQDCCEHAFWTISKDKEGKDIIHHGDDASLIGNQFPVDGFVFDPGFYENVSNQYEESNIAIFRLVKISYKQFEEIVEELFIRLENHHNGYYSHGFTFRGSIIVNDSL